MGRRIRDYKPIEFRQLCMVVKMLLQQAPMIDDAEWKARSRDHLQKLGFDEPDPETLSRAMTQVEQALKQTIGPRLPSRPIPTPERRQEPQPEQPRETGRTNKPAGWDIVVSMMRSLRKASPVLEGTSPQQPPAREILGITKVAALNEFWRQIREGADKLALLRAFAEVAIVRPDGWNYDEIRAEFRGMRFNAGGCFVCFFDETHQHHIIQIQHGGSNYVRNLVALCERCHGTVHPWLTTNKKRTVRGWSKLAEINIAEVLETLRKGA